MFEHVPHTHTHTHTTPGRKKYEPRIQKMTTVDPLQYIRRRVGSSVRSTSSSSFEEKEDESLSGEKKKSEDIHKMLVHKQSSMTSKGESLISYCKSLVKEQLEKGNTVKYNNIKRSVIAKFDRETYDVYKDEVRVICRDSTCVCVCVSFFILFNEFIHIFRYID